MQHIVNAAIIIRRTATVLVAVSCGALIVHAIAPSGTMAAQATSGFERIAGIALNDRSDLAGLLLVCATIGVLVMMDRRRRSRVRQASN